MPTTAPDRTLDATLHAPGRGDRPDPAARRLLGVECKRADAPKLTPSIRIAMDDLRLERMAVVYPGTRRYALDERVEVVLLAAFTERRRLFGDG